MPKYKITKTEIMSVVIDAEDLETAFELAVSSDKDGYLKYNDGYEYHERWAAEKVED